MIDYQEVRKKDGTKVVFCNLKNLLFERFNIKTEEELFPFCNSNGEYICRCPFCEKEGHTKHKLYVKDDYSVGHCFVCGRAYSNVTDEINIQYKVPSFVESTFSKPFEIVPMCDPLWTLDKLYTEFDLHSEKGEKYLCGRQPFLKDLIGPLEFRFFDGNVIIPFKWNGSPIYYQMRFTGRTKKPNGKKGDIRYFFPKTTAKPPYVLDIGQGTRRIAICEGVFDAIAILIMSKGSYIPIAVLGSSVNEYQMSFIRQYCPEEILVYMDETEISERIRQKLMSVFDYCPINIIKSNGLDPEEILNKKYYSGKDVFWIKPGMFNNEPKWTNPKFMW